MPINEVPYNELPASFFEAILSDLIQYSIGFIRVDETPHGLDIVLLGSGTLIKAGATYAVLTAHHVLEVLPRKGRLGIILSSSPRPETIDTQGLLYHKIARGAKGSDRPDLGAVIIAPNIAVSIQASQTNKVFYNLGNRRDLILNTPPCLEDGLWFINGFIGERTIVVNTDDKLIKGFQHLIGKGSPEPAVTVGDYDYFTFPVNHVGSSVAPKSFGGMSGGGLWQVLLMRNANGNISHKSPLLSGVVFYQDAESSLAVRCHCHGRKSIYQIAYDALYKD